MGRQATTEGEWQEPQFLPDGEGGTMEPEKNEAIDKRLNNYLAAKRDRADATDAMTKAKEELIAIMVEQGMEVYRYFHDGEYFTAELSEEAKVSIVKDRPDPA